MAWSIAYLRIYSALFISSCFVNLVELQQKKNIFVLADREVSPTDW